VVEVGQHFYWTLGGFMLHGQVLINSWIVLLFIFFFGYYYTRDLQLIPSYNQSFIEFITEFVRDIAKNQMGEKTIQVG